MTRSVPGPASSFTCALCGERFVKERDGWSDEEAVAERASLFGGERQPDDAVVCDDCFQRVLRVPERVLG